MIIQANTPEGAKAKIYLASGLLCELPIKSYDTETKEVTHYELDENGKVKLTDWIYHDKGQNRSPITKTVKLEGSYATIDGVRV